jgi:hypothetical protein
MRMHLKRRDLQALSCVNKLFNTVIQENVDLCRCKSLLQWDGSKSAASNRGCDAVGLSTKQLERGVVVHCAIGCAAEPESRLLPEYSCVGVFLCGTLTAGSHSTPIKLSVNQMLLGLFPDGDVWMVWFTLR